MIFKINPIIPDIAKPPKTAYADKTIVKLINSSGIIGFILNIISIFYKKGKNISVKNNVVYIVLFIVTIPLAWLLFNMAMSV